MIKNKPINKNDIIIIIKSYIISNIKDEFNSARQSLIISFFFIALNKLNLKTKMKGIIWIILQLISIHLISVNCTCAIEKDPNILTTCFQIDFTSIILGKFYSAKKKF